MEQICPHCKTTSYQNPNMKLKVNVCGHKMCESCIDSVFHHPSASCPECGIILRRNQFREQQFEDTYVEKEVEIRKKILKDYNMCEEDFPSLNAYNDYLEEVEAIIFNLANGIDVEETKERIELYKKANHVSIQKNRQRQLRNEQFVKNQLELEKQETLLKSRRLKEEEIEAIKDQQRYEELLLDELMSSDRPAEEVFAEARAVKRFKEENSASDNTPVFSKTQFQEQKGTVAFEPFPLNQGDMYCYQPLSFDTHGPPVPDMDDLERYGYLENVRKLEPQFLAGGFTPAHACHRALQEAFSCLTLSLRNR